MRLEVRVGERTRQVEVQRFRRGYSVTIDGSVYRVDAVRPEGPVYSLLIGSESYELGVLAQGSNYTVEVGGIRYRFDLRDPSRRRVGEGPTGREPAGPREILAVMPGRVVEVLVRPGQKVEAGQGLVILEAMKMENEVQSPKAGVVSAVHVSKGETLESGSRLVTVN